MQSIQNPKSIGDRVAFLKGLKDTYAGYSEDGKFFIMSTDMQVVMSAVREYAKRNKAKTTFGYPTVEG